MDSNIPHDALSPPHPPCGHLLPQGGEGMFFAQAQSAILRKLNLRFLQAQSAIKLSASTIYLLVLPGLGLNHSEKRSSSLGNCLKSSCHQIGYIIDSDFGEQQRASVTGLEN